MATIPLTRISYFLVALSALLPLVVPACSKGEKAQARGAEEPARAIRTEPVKTTDHPPERRRRRTLAADEQVTISAEASGSVRRILADLGDRVTAGQALVEIDREKLQYNADEQRAALERTLAKYGAASPDRLPPIEQTPDVQKAASERLQAQQALTGRPSSTSDNWCPSSCSTMPTRPFDPSRPATRSRCRTPGTCGPTSPPPSRRQSSPIASCGIHPFARRSTATSRSVWCRWDNSSTSRRR